ncbi:DUF4013 domain-containing protein [Haloarcula sediminis]|uniref:DUF4013 domain-containing protein n=1 Tax=Haloarcula sediminis TaxID=3111777 RepID=UPI002D76E964|nr:DUF4013 domain-containing protein [Haloarcula sp. CK38]
MIEAALRYQTQGEDWVKRVAIGGVAMLLAFLIFLPIFTVYGYILEVMRRVLRGDTETPPEWGDYDIVQLSINGAKGFAILFVYGLVVGVVTLLPAGVLLLLGALLGSGTIAALGTLIGGVLYLVGVVAIAIVAPIMICNFIIKDDLSAGFDIDVLRTFITNRVMLRAVGLAVVVNFAVGVVSGVLGVTIIGAPIGFVVTFVGLSAVAYIWATGFADAYREEIGELPAIPDGPTKMEVVQRTAAGDTTATSGTPEDIASGPSESGDADGDASGPDPTDGDRWD